MTDSYSPDRLDALVWALSALNLGRRRSMLDVKNWGSADMTSPLGVPTLGWSGRKW
jgi:hypothetical protein